MKSLLDKAQLNARKDLERKYLPATYDSGVWDDWPHNVNSMAAKFQQEWAAFNKSKSCAWLTNAPIIDRNGLALDQAVAAAPGVKPLRRNRHITRQCGYAFVFLYNRDAFDGLDGNVFRRALSMELGFEFGTT